MCRAKEALEAIKAMDSPTITPAQAATVIGCNPHWIRIKARTDPMGLGFPVITYGDGNRRTRIPRIQFIQFMEGAR